MTTKSANNVFEFLNSLAIKNQTTIKMLQKN